ncbi:MAG: acyltransferase [Blautia sp.]|nr:acyltransferase [Blautia sp.]
MKTDTVIEMNDPIVASRTEIMGLAILMIMFCHSKVVISNSYMAKWYDIVKNICQSGVDVFLFLSGMGCYYSMIRHRNILIFYKNRALRIFPVYMLIIPFRIMIDMIYDGYTWKDAVYRYSLVSFFMDGTLVTWFIAGILVLYLCFPVIYYILKRNENAFLVFAALYLVCVCMIHHMSQNGIEIPGWLRRDVFYIRVLPFLTGAYYGKISRNDHGSLVKILYEKANILIIMLAYFFCLCVYDIQYNTVDMWYILRLLFFPISVLVITGSAFVINKTNKNTFLRFLGKMTLELYLLHEWMLHIASKLLFQYMERNFCTTVLLNILVFLWSIFLADLIHRFLGKSILRTIRPGWKNS